MMGVLKFAQREQEEGSTIEVDSGTNKIKDIDDMRT
jgi:hypothetical protein